jgi:hypothetical protein
MITQDTLLVILAKPVDHVPVPPPAPKQRRGHPKVYSDRLFLKARRLAGIPDPLPAQIGCFGRALVLLIQPWARCGRAAAIDSSVLRANGGVWHNKHREQGVVPHTSIDTESHWTKPGWHAWAYAWRLHLVSVVAATGIPLAADLTPATVVDNGMAPGIIRELPLELCFVLGDEAYHCTTVPVASSRSV